MVMVLSTEQCCCAWLCRNCYDLLNVPGHLTSEQKLERFITATTKEWVAGRTQFQAY